MIARFSTVSGPFWTCAVLALPACSAGTTISALPNDTSEDSATSEGKTDQAPPDTASEDTGSEDTVGTAPIALPACLGESAELIVSGQGLPYASVSVGTASGWFLLDWATTGSTIDTYGFSGAERPKSLEDGTSDDYADFEFFGPWGTVHLAPQDHSGVHGSVRQAGILGTDFLALHVYTLDFRAAVPGEAPGPAVYRAPGAGCADDVLLDLGLAALSTRTYFSNNLNEVVGPNVPTVPVRIGGTDAVAQLDTGFDDVLVPRSVNVNTAFFDAIPESARGARRADLDLALSTCVGIAEPVEAYEPAVPLEFVGPSGDAVRTVPGVILFVKRTPAAASQCGGIGTWSSPAAQVGASILSASGLVVFDPLTSRTWMRRD